MLVVKSEEAETDVPVRALPEGKKLDRVEDDPEMVTTTL